MQDAGLKLSKTEIAILETYKILARGLADYLGEGCEVILHSLQDLDHSVVEIVNGYHSGRSVGSPITDLALSFLENSRKNSGERYLTYFNKSKKGQPLKSCTISIPGDRDRIIGLLCINLYLDTPFFSMIGTFFPGPGPAQPGTVTENFSENTDDLIREAVESAKRKVYNDDSVSAANRNKEIIGILYAKGIFSLKDAVGKISDMLSISRNTVYMHIRNLSRR